ncbi:MAG: carboxypeptidase-like regulatory domain-containing protein [Myxococcaceae bacterium]
MGFRRLAVMLGAFLPAIAAGADPTTLGPARVPDLEGVAGILADGLTNAPLPGVVVVASGLDVVDRMATTTDARGLFHLPALRPGLYELWARVPGSGRAATQTRVEAGSAELVGLALFREWVHPAEPPASSTQVGDKPGPLRFEVRVLHSTFAVGEPIPLLGLFRNIGPEPVVVIKEVDGSTFKQRNPSYRVHAVAVSQGTPAPAALQEGGGCGNSNALFPGDVAEVPPGATVDPFELLDEYHFRTGRLRADAMFAFDRPGKYAVWVEYSNLETTLGRVGKCGYQQPGTGLSRGGIDRERLRAAHLPIPDRAPLRVEGLRSNRVEFEIVGQLDAAGLSPSPPPIKAPFEPGRIVVQVRDALGRPIPKASVSGLGIFVGTGDGRFTRANVIPGRYEISASDSEGNSIGRQTIAVGPGAERTVRFQKGGFGSLRLVVKNHRKEGTLPTLALLPGRVPMPESLSSLRREGTVSYQPRPGPELEPVFPHLPDGKYTLFICRNMQFNRSGVFRQELEVRVNDDQLLEIDLPDELPIIPTSGAKKATPR